MFHAGLQKLRAGFEGLLQGIRMDHVLPDHAVAAPALAGAAETHAHLVQQAAFQLRQLQAQAPAATCTLELMQAGPSLAWLREQKLLE